ncbi:MAG: bifunctional UDP-N-acetylglucosamine diphosphorylase/glucosamine-1-phosphate N-acetyltransferase GlmU [Legionellaceae bacterium]|nr:bifunctional UDP-N-acetylglucosamine diphosphorylase/glucosamine-1-phosphate N-acetyltransferase GlmU [Legionellaceae bacterium]
MKLHVVILAAGQGTRMRSQLPKVLHPLAGKPLLQWVLDACKPLAPACRHVIVGHQRERIQNAIGDPDIHWVEQSQQQGTGHAVLQALPFIPHDATVLILYADVPLIDPVLLKKLLSDTDAPEFLHLLTAQLADPGGLGRVIRDRQQQVLAIVEEKDASDQQRQIKEIYSGICAVSASALQRWLPQLTAHNAQQEYYLTDIIAMAVAEQMPVQSCCTEEVFCIAGVNNRSQLHQLERHWQQQQAEKLMLAGVSLADANRFDLRGELHCAADVFIDANVIIEGQVHIAEGCHIGAHCFLRNCRLEAGVRIHPFSHIEGASIGAHSQIGPYARLREGTTLAEHCKIGNFVETKQTRFGAHSKASHLSYLGDSLIGREVNIGAGTITCNYDGVHKHQTIIEDGAFIGSDSQLVAPVTIGRNATIGAGSTIRKDAPAEQLSLSRQQQISIPGWKRPKK